MLPETQVLCGLCVSGLCVVFFRFYQHDGDAQKTSHSPETVRSKPTFPVGYYIKKLW